MKIQIAGWTQVKGHDIAVEVEGEEGGTWIAKEYKEIIKELEKEPQHIVVGVKDDTR